MPFDPTSLSLNELLQRAQRVSGGNLRDALDYCKPIQTRAARSAVAAILHFRERHPGAGAFNVDRMGRLQPAEERAVNPGSVMPSWVSRVSV